MKPFKPAAPAKPSWMFPAIERPSFTDSLAFPEDLTLLSSPALGQAHGRFTSILAYASSELSKHVVTKLKLETELSIELNRKVVTLSVQNIQRWKINNVVESSLSVVTMRRQVMDANIAIETIRTFKENYERYAAALSREMSRRASEQRVNQA